MTGEVDITHGGAIAVDPDALRAVASGMSNLAPQFGEAGDAMRRAYRIIVDTPGLSEHVDTVALRAGGDRADALQAECEEAANGTSLMADVFEVVELQAQLDAMTLADAAGAVSIQARIDQLVASDERVSDMATMVVASWQKDLFEGLDSQFELPSGVSKLGLGPLFSAAAAAGLVAGMGVVKPGTVLSGTAGPVSVRPVVTSSPAAPPASLAEAFRRFPTSPDAQLKIERYTMPDGSQRFVLYAKGTQSPGWGGSEPWDMKSNTQLYLNERSDSYQATLDALEDAGAQAGDQVDIYAHSQTAMIAAHMAMESEFDVRVQATAGSPVEPTLNDDQYLIQLRHTDDLVSSLAGGGSPGGTGSPESFVATRVGDPAKGLQDLALQTHQMETYIETAEMVDASGDVRLQPIQESWEELATAVEIESTEYVAKRE